MEEIFRKAHAQNAGTIINMWMEKNSPPASGH